jgi:hypothetical protein
MRLRSLGAIGPSRYDNIQVPFVQFKTFQERSLICKSS